MNLKISFEKAQFNDSPFGSERKCVVVEFPNCISVKTNKSFKWMPTYEQLKVIKNALDKIEEESWGK